MMRHPWMLPTFLFAWLGLAAVASAAEAIADAAASPRRVYPGLLEPREHPDYDRRAVKPPSWETFGNRTQFITLRSFPSKDGEIVQYQEEIDRYTRQYKLGDVLWPDFSVLAAKNLGEVADEIQRRKLYLFDLWSYVPGAGPPAIAFISIRRPSPCWRPSSANAGWEPTSASRMAATSAATATC